VVASKTTVARNLFIGLKNNARTFRALKGTHVPKEESLKERLSGSLTSQTVQVITIRVEKVHSVRSMLQTTHKDCPVFMPRCSEHQNQTHMQIATPHPVNRCHVCGATSYHYEIVRNDKAQLQKSNTLVCDGCGRHFESVTAWKVCPALTEN
jgi:hypothetical protein